MGAPLVAPLTGHLDVALTNFAKGFVQNELVSDIVAPRVPVGRQTDKYWIFGRESQELLQQTLRATGAPAQRIRMSLSTGSYSAVSHALAAEIADEDRLGYEPGSLEQDATATLMAKILLDKDDRLATLITDTSVVTQNVTLAGADQWNNFETAKPLTNVETGKAVIRKSGVRPNLMVMGEDVFTKLINFPSLLELFKYTTQGPLDEAKLAVAFGIDRVVVGRGVKIDKAGTATTIFGKDVVICYVSATPGARDISFAKTFVWSGAPGTVGGIGTVIGRQPDPTAKGDILGVDFYYDQKVTAVETGYLIKAAVA